MTADTDIASRLAAVATALVPLARVDAACDRLLDRIRAVITLETFDDDRRQAASEVVPAALDLADELDWLLPPRERRIDILDRLALCRNIIQAGEGVMTHLLGEATHTTEWHERGQEWLRDVSRRRGEM